jgi:hypothetical protein
MSYGAHAMGDDNHRQTLPLQLPERPLHHGFRLRVQGGRHFVQQKQSRAAS